MGFHTVCIRRIHKKMDFFLLLNKFRGYWLPENNLHFQTGKKWQQKQLFTSFSSVAKATGCVDRRNEKDISWPLVTSHHSHMWQCKHLFCRGLVLFFAATAVAKEGLGHTRHSKDIWRDKNKWVNEYIYDPTIKLAVYVRCVKEKWNSVWQKVN